VNDALEEKILFTGIGRKPVILLQDNARPHKAKKTLKTIADLGWEILPHTAYRFSRLDPFWLSPISISATPP